MAGRRGQNLGEVEFARRSGVFEEELNFARRSGVL
jgi:hypothetical protein